ncbi:MAG: hypothetical protein L0228_09470 [Planctomycetes bacterium]|nr:hypothetical protein [Planctomycetota bacterium]
MALCDIRKKFTRFETIPIRVPIEPKLAIRSGRGGSHVVSPFLLLKIHAAFESRDGRVGLSFNELEPASKRIVAGLYEAGMPAFAGVTDPSYKL